MNGVPTRTWRNDESGVTFPDEVLLGFIEITAAEPLQLLRGPGPGYRCQRVLGSSTGNSTGPSD